VGRDAGPRREGRGECDTGAWIVAGEVAGDVIARAKQKNSNAAVRDAGQLCAEARHDAAREAGCWDSNQGSCQDSRDDADEALGERIQQAASGS
jgi:hypothetical protein